MPHKGIFSAIVDNNSYSPNNNVIAFPNNGGETLNRRPSEGRSVNAGKWDARLKRNPRNVSPCRRAKDGATICQRFNVYPSRCAVAVVPACKGELDRLPGVLRAGVKAER
eukprot:418697-Amphidinium_carterae.2